MYHHSEWTRDDYVMQNISFNFHNNFSYSQVVASKCNAETITSKSRGKARDRAIFATKAKRGK